MPTHTIFPPFHPHKSWRAIDDRIRGGSSVSHLDPLKGNSEGAVRFWGTLDTRTLGGAGFASQCRSFEEVLWLPEAEFKGLAVTVITEESQASSKGEAEKDGPREPYEYTVTLKTSVPDLRPDGRRESTISYEYTFTVPRHIKGSASPQHQRIVIPWHAFTATYRGRTLPSTDPSYVPLDPGSTSPDGKKKGGIHELSLMCRSGFGRQEGEFELGVVRIEAVGVEEPGMDLEAQRNAQRRFRGMFNWVTKWERG